MEEQKRTALIKKIKETTKKWEKDNAFSDLKETGLTEREKKIIEIIKCFSQEKNNIIKLFSVLLDKDISSFCSSSSTSVSYCPFCAVVPLKNDNSHDYPLGKVCLGRGSACIMVREDGTTGNNLAQIKASVRPATEEEIDQIPDCQLEGLIKQIPGLIFC